MEEILACRACLATDTKLFSLYKHDLKDLFTDFSGFEVQISDGLPQHICNFCCTLLLKCAAFRSRCRTSQQLLEAALRLEHKITIDYIRSIDRTLHNLTLLYTTQTNTKTIDYTEIDVSVKEEIHDTKDNVHDTEETLNDEVENTVVWAKSKFDEGQITHVDVCQVTDSDNIKSDMECDSDTDIFDKVKKKDKRKKRSVQSEKVTRNGKESDFAEFSKSYNVDVVILSKEEQIEEVELRKESANYLNSSYRCEECYKGFLAEAAFRNHMTTHDPRAGAHVCGVCGARYPHGSRLRYHLASHRLKFVCRQCKHVSKYRHQAKQHYKWHGGYKYICKYCGASFEKRTSHFSHVRLQHPAEHTSCEICGETFIGDYGVMQHKKKAHRHQISSEASAHRCTSCDLRFLNSVALDRHLNTAGNGVCDANMRWCVECGEGFPTERLLREHQKRPHVDLNDKYKCDECNKTFATEASHHTHHQRVHLNVKYKQKHPKKGGRGRGAGRGGERGEPPAPHRPESVVCEICGKKYGSTGALKFHQRAHSGERPHQCPQCPKRFTMPVFLQYHLRTHTGERPYKCPLCSKAFKIPTALQRHKRIHTGERPYTCHVCDKRFSTSTSVKIHVRTVHMKIPPPPRARRRGRGGATRERGAPSDAGAMDTCTYCIRC